MKANITIEWQMTGPLSTKAQVRALDLAVASSADLTEVVEKINRIPGMACYRGGSHIAVHPTYNGIFAKGSDRIALIIPENDGASA